MSENDNKFEVSDGERQKINGAAAAKYSNLLLPGERLDIELHRDAEHASVQFVMSGLDDVTRVELEAAVLDEDEHPDPPTVKQRLHHALDFVDAMFEQFLDDKREGRFHTDWRVYEFEGVLVRFRGAVTSPSIEALADAWLASHGDPGEGD